ncbi:hypothetical protein BC936DRAFT_139863, partial [Jimgerdemannia flammicorona]
MQPLLHNETLSHVRKAVSTCLKATEHSAYSRLILAKYWEDGPLSNNKIIFDMMILLRNALARVVVNRNIPTSPPSSAPISNGDSLNHRVSTEHTPNGNMHSSESINARDLMRVEFCEAWGVHNPSSDKTQPLPFADAEREQLARGLRALYVMSLAYYTDIKGFSEQSVVDGKKLSPDAYWKDIMGASL